MKFSVAFELFSFALSCFAFGFAVATYLAVTGRRPIYGPWKRSKWKPGDPIDHGGWGKLQ